MKFTSIDEIKAANRRAGLHWFEPGTNRFFRTIVLPYVYGGRYFVTSERCTIDHERLYSVREALADGSIDTVGEFQQYASARAAKAAAKDMAAKVTALAAAAAKS